MTGTSFDTAVPLRTRVTVNRAGNCTTSFPLEMGFDADNSDSQRLRLLSGTEAVLRRHDGNAIAQFVAKDVFASTALATLPDTCRVSLTFTWNEPDVSTKADAQAIIATLQSDLTTKLATRDNYKSLTLYHRAFLFLNAVTEEYHTELTNDSIQQLRALATNSIDALGNVISSCTADISPDDRSNLMFLLASLPVLGDPTEWQKPDGTTKTLADVMDSTAGGSGQIYLTVKKLAESAGAGTENDYDKAYADAQLAATKAQAKLAQATQQLAAWLK